MSEIVFVVEEAPEGEFIAYEGKAPKLIRLHYVRDEIIGA